MKEHPIIMSGNHPRLTLDGTKTMTRRTWGLEEVNKNPNDWCFIEENTIWQFVNKTGLVVNIKCPYGQVGDRLWVRETHYRWGYWAKNGITKTGRQKWTFKAVSNTTGGLRFPDNRPPFGETDRTQMGWHKRPSIFMPRWASRITLEITEVRAERLQEITEEDAEAEGVSWSPVGDGENPEIISAVENFATLWDSLNAKRGYTWETNPWVWVITFKAIGVRLK